MRNSRKLKLRRCAPCIIGLNDYFDAFLGSKSNDKIGDMYLNDIHLKSIPNGWSKKAYVCSFDCETITY